MGLFDALRGGAGHHSQHSVCHIADEPQIVSQENIKYMVFHVAEVPGTEFRLKMLPTTPKRRKGDRVEMTWAPGQNGAAMVETMYSAPDMESRRRRNAEYLHSIETQDANERH